MKYGVIDVGGGLRGIYGAGVLDRCLEEDLRFDLCIGVSAGSANMASYLAGQHGRNKPFYDEYSFRREYMSVHNLIHKHSYLDLGYVYGTLSNAGGENPLDYAALARSPAELCVVAANAQNGEAQYFTKADLHPDDYRVLMASCCIPVIDQPCVIDGVPYFDGGLADPVPLELAFAHGCDRVALILTKPIGLVSSDARDKHLAHLLQSHYPAAAEGLRRRAWRYNTAVQRARELERQGLVRREPCPEDRRCQLVYPTERALEIVPKVRKLVCGWNDHLLAELSEDERDQLQALMERVSQRARDYIDREVGWDA